MKYIISENRFNSIIGKYIEKTYGDIEMTTDEDGYVNFFSSKLTNDEGYPKRIAHKNLYGTLWINQEDYQRMGEMFGVLVSHAIGEYFKNKFGIEVKRIHQEF